SHFVIGGVEENFKLKSLGYYSGNAGDALSPSLNMEIQSHFGSRWWLSKNIDSDLNGMYISDRDELEDGGITWDTFSQLSLQFVQMMIRPA
ncbi:hypothetical protein AWZ03_015415, partial [Drosophila navojoa]